jgi:hypothetical protein
MISFVLMNICENEFLIICGLLIYHYDPFRFKDFEIKN